jgi:hypothetical protein
MVTIAMTVTFSGACPTTITITKAVFDNVDSPDGNVLSTVIVLSTSTTDTAVCNGPATQVGDFNLTRQ